MDVSGGKTEGLMTLAAGAERQNYIADSHTKNKSLKLPKLNPESLVLKRKIVWGSGVY